MRRGSGLPPKTFIRQPGGHDQERGIGKKRKAVQHFPHVAEEISQSQITIGISISRKTERADATVALAIMVQSDSRPIRSRNVPRVSISPIRTPGSDGAAHGRLRSRASRTRLGGLQGMPPHGPQGPRGDNPPRSTRPTGASLLSFPYFVLSWRRGSELNRRIKVLQTFALPLGYRAGMGALQASYRGQSPQVNLYASASPCSVPQMFTAIPISANIAAFAASAAFAAAASLP